jgi:hypothetical protein
MGSVILLVNSTAVPGSGEFTIWVGFVCRVDIGFGDESKFRNKKSRGEEFWRSMPDASYKLLPLYMIHPRAHYAPFFRHREC